MGFFSVLPACVVRACAALRGEGDDDAGGRGRQRVGLWAVATCARAKGEDEKTARECV